MNLTIKKFSDLAIKKALLNTDVSEIRIEGEPFILRVHSSRNKGAWYHVEHKGGKTIRRKIANWPAFLAIDLGKMAREIVGKFVTDKPIVVDEFDHVGDLLRWYRLRVLKDRSLSDSRKISIKSALDKHLIPKLMDVKLSELTKSLVDDFILDMQQEYELSYIRLIFNVLRVAFRKAITLEKINHHPLITFQWVDFVKLQIKPRGTRLERKHLEIVQVRIKLSEAAPRTLAYLMLAYGLRIGEARQIEWEHIDFDNDEMIIPAKNTKTRKKHSLPLTAQAKRHLIEFKKNAAGKFLFQSPKAAGAISPMTASSWIQCVSNREWTGHDLRKLARSMWADLGIDYFIAELLLNHTPSKLDLAYIHTHAKSQKLDALNKWHECLSI